MPKCTSLFLELGKTFGSNGPERLENLCYLLLIRLYKYRCFGEQEEVSGLEAWNNLGHVVAPSIGRHQYLSMCLRCILPRVCTETQGRLLASVLLEVKGGGAVTTHYIQDVRETH